MVALVWSEGGVVEESQLFTGGQGHSGGARVRFTEQGGGPVRCGGATTQPGGDRSRVGSDGKQPLFVGRAQGARREQQAGVGSDTTDDAVDRAQAIRPPVREMNSAEVGRPRPCS